MTAEKSVLIFGSYPPPFGGVPRHIQELAPVMAARGWNVHVVAGGHSGVVADGAVTIYKEPRSKKLVRAARAAFSSSTWAAADALLFQRRVADKILFAAWTSLGREIIRKHPVKLISVYNLLRVPAGLHLSQQFGLPLVISCFGEAYSHRSVLMERRDIVDLACRSASQLFSMTEHCAASYRSLGLTPTVTLTPYGVDVNRFRPMYDVAGVRSRFGLGTSDLVILFVGRMIRDMGIHTLLETIPDVLSKQPRARFVVAGGSGDMTPVIRSLESRYPGRIFLFADVPADDLPLVYATADIVVAPTQGARACGSLASLEAMSSGKAVVAARVGGVPEIVVDHVTGVLVPPENSQALSEALLLLLAEPDRRVEMGRLGRKRATKHFDKDVLNGRIEELLSQVASRAAPFAVGA